MNAGRRRKAGQAKRGFQGNPPRIRSTAEFEAFKEMLATPEKSDQKKIPSERYGAAQFEISLGNNVSGGRMRTTIPDDLRHYGQKPIIKKVGSTNPFHGDWGRIEKGVLTSNPDFVKRFPGFFQRDIKGYFEGTIEPVWVGQRILGDEILFPLFRILRHEKVLPLRVTLTDRDILVRTIQINSAPQAIVQNLATLFRNLQHAERGGVKFADIIKILKAYPTDIPVYLRHWDEIAPELIKMTPGPKSFRILLQKYADIEKGLV